MKKRTLPVLAVVAALSSAAFVACGEDHVHDYKWDSGADAHWQICECGDKTAEEAHVDVKNNETGAEGADELCDACGRNLHVHSYTWHSDSAGHWEECACGDKHAAVAHADVKNNETGAEEADGACDVCGHDIHAVTFNVLGHGTAPAVQHVGEGAHAADPGALEDDDSWRFKGWYKDEACTVAYDFAAETISGATTVYAKWEEDSTAGASKKYAHALSLSQENQQAAKLGESVYYKHTAAEAGRYTVELALGASANGTFTIDKADGTFGLDCDAESVTIDLDSGETVHICYTYKGASADGVTVSPLVSPVTDEPLPADWFLAGEYISDGVTYVFEFNRSDKQITYSQQTYTARYIGGKFDTLSFVRTTPQGDEKYSIKHNANGGYTLTVSLSGASAVVALSYVTPQPPVALSELFGYYEPANYTPGPTEPDDPIGPDPRPDADHGSSSEGASGITGGITELYIYRSESTNATAVRYKSGSVYSDLIDATYDTAKNRLSFGQYTITLNLNASNAIESVTFGGNRYLRKGDAPAIPPAKLPLTINSEYNGATTAIRTPNGSQILGATGNNGITVMDYVASTGMYTVAVNMGATYATYKLTVSADGSTVVLYDAEGTLVDTLSKFVWDIGDFACAGDSVELSVAADEFRKGLRLYEVQESGYYEFAIPAGVEVWKRLNPNDYTDTEYVLKISDAPVWLEEGDLFAVYMQTPSATSVTVSRSAVPIGSSEDVPAVLDNGTVTLDVPDAQTYYFSYTAPSAGSYLVKVTHDGDNHLLTYTVNGTQCGIDFVSSTSYSGVTYTNPYATVEVSADNLTLDIRVESTELWKTITVSVSENYSAGATDLALSGEPQGDSLTVTATAATGANYHIDSTKGADVTVTGSAAFVVKVQGGNILEAQESAGVYTATISAGGDVYFRLISDTQQTLTLSQTFAKGSEGYPNEVAITGNTASITLAMAEGEQDPVSGYYVLPAGSYTLSHNVSPASWWILVHVFLNGEEKYSNDGLYILSVNEGDVLCIEHNNTEAALEVTITKPNALFSDEQAGSYNGAGTVDYYGSIYEYDITLSFDKYGNGTYSIDDGVDTLIFDILISADGSGGYTFTYDGGYYNVTFAFDNGHIILTDEDKSDEDVSMEKTAIYIGVVGEIPSRLIIKGNAVTYYYDDELMVQDAAVTKNGETYSFSYESYGDTYTVSYTVDGDTIELDDFGLTGTLTKQA